MAASVLAKENLLVPTVLGVGLSGFFSGANFALSYMAMPGLLLSAARSQSQTKDAVPSNGKARPAMPASQLARQWRAVFLKGKSIGPLVGLTSSLCFAYVAWNLPSTSSSYLEAEKDFHSLKWIFVAAAGMTISIVPWTLIFMESTNATLLERAGQADANAEMGDADTFETGVKGNRQGLGGWETADLMYRWSQLNLIRSSLPFSSVLIVALGLFLYG